MKSLVIGGNGFIGTNLVDALLKSGHEVRVFDRFPGRFKEPLSEVEYLWGDLGNHGEMAEVVRGVDYVYHLAYTTLPHTSNEDPLFDIRSNLIDTVQLLQECRQAAVKKIIFMSSGGTVYGIPETVPIKESHSTNPICSYGITKLAIEKYLSLFHRLYGLEYLIARISNPYGEQQNPGGKQGAVTVFLGNVLSKKPIVIWGDGEVVRDYIYIGDVAEALVKAAGYDPSASGQRLFNIAAGEGYSLNQLVEIIRGVVNREVEVRYEPGRPEDVPQNVLDISMAKKHLNWKPKVTLTEGLSRTWQWLERLQPV